jgi:hypothetical protein
LNNDISTPEHDAQLRLSQPRVPNQGRAFRSIISRDGNVGRAEDAEVATEHIVTSRLIRRRTIVRPVQREVSWPSPIKAHVRGALQDADFDSHGRTPLRVGDLHLLKVSQG